MSDSSDFDGSFVPNKASRKKKASIYSDEEIWESDQDSDVPVKRKSKKPKNFIVDDSESDSASDRDFSSPKKSRKSSKKIETDSGFRIFHRMTDRLQTKRIFSYFSYF